jgi:hypothetical protein
VTAHSEQLAPPLRWLLVPFAGLAFVATVLEVVRRRTRQPAVGPMSDEWLRDHKATRSE